MLQVGQRAGKRNEEMTSVCRIRAVDPFHRSPHVRSSVTGQRALLGRRYAATSPPLWTLAPACSASLQRFRRPRLPTAPDLIAPTPASPRPRRLLTPAVAPGAGSVGFAGGWPPSSGTLPLFRALVFTGKLSSLLS
jgi:hypothetical protein